MRNLALRKTSPPSGRVSVADIASPDEVAGSFAHDLRSPLSAMSMNLDFAMSELPRTPDLEAVHGALADCRAAAARAFRLIADMVDLARIEANTFVPQSSTFDLAEIVESVAAACRDEAQGRRVAVERISDQVRADTDRDVVTRITEGLFEYAVRATRPGGRILARAMKIRGRAVVEVLAEATPPDPGTLFGKLPRSGERGAARGLSMYFCRRAARALGGDLELITASDLPTCLRLTLG
jgi:signal transduction histidine kinase